MNPRNLEIAARVEFRWRQHEEQFAERLAESAREAGRSPSDHARELMKTALTSAEILQHSLQNLEQELSQVHARLSELVEFKAGLDDVQQNIYQLRDDLATGVTMLLTHAGQLEDDAAKQWVEESLDTE